MAIPRPEPEVRAVEPEGSTPKSVVAVGASGGDRGAVRRRTSVASAPTPRHVRDA